MRELHSHKINPVNDKLRITVLDLPDNLQGGGASHHYQVELPSGVKTQLNFQHGAIADVGINGITQEALLVVVADRLRGFQSGPYACRENAIALTKVEEALLWLHARTLLRVERGVEGTQAV